MLLISETYLTYDAEGNEIDSGMRLDNEPFTFSELVDFIKENYTFSEPSSSGKPTTDTWLTNHEAGHYTHTYFSMGHTETRSLHFSRDNKASLAKYWLKALLAAQIYICPKMT